MRNDIFIYTTSTCALATVSQSVFHMIFLCTSSRYTQQGLKEGLYPLMSHWDSWNTRKWKGMVWCKRVEMGVQSKWLNASEIHMLKARSNTDHHSITT